MVCATLLDTRLGGCLCLYSNLVPAVCGTSVPTVPIPPYRMEGGGMSLALSDYGGGDC